MLFEAIKELLGTLPPGFEPLLYIISALFLLYLISTLFSIIWSILSFIGGK